MRPLYHHQAKALAYARQHAHPLLFLEMRLGKTLVTLRRLKELERGGSPLRALVVAPRSALESWRDECTQEGIATTDLSQGPKRDRLERLLGFRAGVALLNREGWRVIPEIARKQWSAVVLDEAHFIKNPRAKVTKFFLGKMCDVPSRWALTGTPCGEGEQDAFCLLRWGARRPGGCGNFWQFRQRFMEPEMYGHGWRIAPHGREMMRQEIGKEALVMRRKDVDLDQVKIREILRVDLPVDVRSAYDEIEDAWSTEDLGGFSTIYSGARWQALRQLADGWLDGQEVHTAKIAELSELILGQFKDDRLVIWASYLAEIERIALEARQGWSREAWTLCGKHKPDERLRILGEWRASACGILVAQPDCLQTGANLSATDTAIYFSSPAGLVARRQSEDRILSVAKAGPLLIIDLVAAGTVDEDLAVALQGKHATSERALARALKIAFQERRKHESEKARKTRGAIR